ncbi:Phosphotyrosyl phosphatase activator [Wallemia mellicola]|uniref:Serine/threonine-protein phosphatase 2A activator n=1 Tax=Wallemia mellicola TaxID=1708541 RepID=A0A4T0LGX9_9BASI|nr:hypothetical protein E3Q24_03522 [Wallemia mellicola]TIB76290.1 Phosphotyrosyl phosphatase activator [Wallemia mellicola]TIB96985.1 Phosphotyrosyl phosphatase activator [Wallemia mellicola]TIC01946.1 Phosphotyrosyl phosphatase activator [Wallemia mellicola]TIC09007.1 Phosphotyrosyl phosphatase activator [Wallemia mellicola]
MYEIPRKRIVLDEHLQLFKSSSTFNAIVEFIDKLNNAVVDVKLTDEVHVSDKGVIKVLQLLDKIDEIASASPPIENNQSRFGNPGFRTFIDKLVENSDELHSGLGIPRESIVELSPYLNESFGNKQRIDYGSGMELNFLCWLICLDKLGLFEDADSSALVLRIFWRYITIMRKLQSTFWLEPAGSHGVWGLDDYHFLPFLWGSGQLSSHKYLRPKSIHDNEVMYEFSSAYMYLGCISFINSIKTASLRWHSPMLDDISAVKSWSKVNEGMFKMYKAEVLGKLPIIQHFLFGSILPCPEGIPEDAKMEDADCGHNHGHVDRTKHHGTFGSDCCGIPVPSAFGEAYSQKSNVKRIPFD